MIILKQYKSPLVEISEIKMSIKDLFINLETESEWLLLTIEENRYSLFNEIRKFELFNLKKTIDMSNV